MGQLPVATRIDKHQATLDLLGAVKAAMGFPSREDMSCEDYPALGRLIEAVDGYVRRGHDAAQFKEKIAKITYDWRCATGRE